MHNEETIASHKRNIIAIGGLLWEKGLVSGLNGNISVRISDDTILITGHKTCLGLLQDKDLLLMKIDGTLLEEGKVSSERLMHTEVYKNFPQIKAVLHTHTTYTNAYFLENEKLEPRIFESKFYLGDVPAVKQTTPSVTDAAPVIEAFKQNNIVVLRNHGVVAMGDELFDCFLLIQALEDAVETEAVSRVFSHSLGTKAKSKKIQTKSASAKRSAGSSKKGKKYKIFSQEQMDNIVKLVNKDRQLKELGEKTNMTMNLAVKMNETGQTYCFLFRRGQIAGLNNDENAEFLISAPENVWRAVFNREIDPFVATTQKKMHLRGDFAKISKWYAPCSRIFEIWQQVPIE